MKDPHLQEWLLGADGIATQLRLLRGEQTGRDFAEAAGMRPAKLSKLELAQQIPTESDIRHVVAAAGQPQALADALVARLRQMPTVRTEGERRLRFGQVAVQRRLNDRLRNAHRIQIFSATHIPRPLQTPSYAAAALRQLDGLQGSVDAAQASAELLSSSQFLYDPSRRFEIVVAEPALRWQVLPPPELRVNLERVLQAAAMPNVQMTILPLDAQLSDFPPSDFSIYDDACYLDGIDEGVELKGAALAGHVSAMGRLRSEGLSGSRAADIIQAAIARLVDGGKVVDPSAE